MLLYITNVTCYVSVCLWEATYENLSVLIRKNYLKEWGAFIPWRRTIFVKILKTVFYRQLNAHNDRKGSNFMLVEDESSCSLI